MRRSGPAIYKKKRRNLAHKPLKKIWLPPKISKDIQNIKKALSQIEKIENDIEKLNISSNEAINYYSNLNEALIQSIFMRLL